MRQIIIQNIGWVIPTPILEVWDSYQINKLITGTKLSMDFDNFFNGLGAKVFIKSDNEELLKISELLVLVNYKELFTKNDKPVPTSIPSCDIIIGYKNSVNYLAKRYKTFIVGGIVYATVDFNKLLEKDINELIKIEDGLKFFWNNKYDADYRYMPINNSGIFTYLSNKVLINNESIRNIENIDVDNGYNDLELLWSLHGNINRYHKVTLVSSLKDSSTEAFRRAPSINIAYILHSFENVPDIFIGEDLVYYRWGSKFGYVVSILQSQTTDMVKVMDEKVFDIVNPKVLMYFKDYAINKEYGLSGDVVNDGSNNEYTILPSFDLPYTATNNIDHLKKGKVTVERCNIDFDYDRSVFGIKAIKHGVLPSYE